ncbi:MAG TPA: NfeD family protein [Burkholderiaceae bacterium]|nr:NfeD family protein [Burkholderiaceae bacterium]
MVRSAWLKVWLCIALVLSSVVVLVTGGVAAQANRVVVFSVQGVIGPATSDYLLKGFKQAHDQGASLIVVQMDTPGGLDPSMRAIVQGILASPVPIATFVSPGGARAASAGTFILYASHIAAMTPASNLGAASPVAVGIGGARDPDAGSRRPGTGPETRRDEPDSRSDSGDGPAQASENDRDPAPSGDQEADRSPAPNTPASPDHDTEPGPATDPGGERDVMAGKVTSDAAAYIRSLAQLRGRNANFAEQAVLTAKSLSATEALEQGVIEFIARDLTHLLAQLDGYEVKISDTQTITLATADAIIQLEPPGWRTKFLSILTNPQLALVLMMVGIYGLFFELTSPGFAVPGVAGLICLLLGLYAFHLLPVNWAGVALVFAGSILMIAEVFFPSFGALGVGGIIAFVLGGLFLTDTGIPGYDVSLPFIIGLAVASALLLMLAGTMVARSRKQTVTTGANAMVGLNGVVTHQEGVVVYAQVRGEQWRVVSSKALTPGDRIRVTAVEGLTLHVEPTK